MKKKKLLYGLIIAIIIVLIIISFVYKNFSNNVGFNNKLYLKDKTIDNAFKIENIKIEYVKKEGYYLLTFEAINLTENRISGDNYLILFKDAKNKTIYEEDGAIIGNINKEGNVFLKMYIYDDISTLEDINVIKKD